MSAVVSVPSVKETEVLAKAMRRGFTAEYKQQIVDEVDRAVIRYYLQRNSWLRMVNGSAL